MKKVVYLGAAIALLSFGGIAHANSSDSNAAAGANSASGSASVSKSKGGDAKVIVNNNQPASNGSGTQYVTGDQTVRTAPTVYAPSVVGGNLCAVGASGAASFLGGGFALGATWESKNCEIRQRAALLFNMGFKGAAKELMCNNKEDYDAFKTAGEPCAVRPDWEPKPTALVKQVEAAPAPAPAKVAKKDECPVRVINGQSFYACQ